MTDDYEIPTGDTGHETGTFLMTVVGLKPFTLYETNKGWTREQPEGNAGVLDTYSKIEWTFSDEDGELGKGSTSVSRSERSTLYAWATGLGIPPAVVLDRSKPIPSSQIIGRSGMVTFQADKNGYSRIVSVVPAPKARGAEPTMTMPAARPAAQPGEFDGAPVTPALEPALQGDVPF